MLKTIAKWTIGILLFVTIALFITAKVMSEEKPNVSPSAEGDALADQMLSALGIDGWDTLHYLQWSFRGEHHYLWDKQKNLATISWDNNQVIMNLDSVDGRAFIGEEEVMDQEKQSLIEDAWSFWCNDSFWLFAPFKVKDPGTSRAVIDEVEYGVKGLLVTYESGGVTPGDSYLWMLDINNRPIGYKMWVSILPVGGLYATWESWTTLPEGAQLATTHQLGPLSISMDNVKSGKNLNDLGIEENPFALIGNS